MTLRVRLVPELGDPDEKLQDGISERPVIEVDSCAEHAEVIVGRGPITGIDDVCIDHMAFRLNFDEACIQAQQVRLKRYHSTECNLYLNGLPWDESQSQVYLSHGDTVALDGLTYEYKVHIETLKPDRVYAEKPAPKKRKAPTSDAISVVSSNGSDFSSDGPSMANVAAAPSIAISALAANRLSEDIQCPVCLEIQVFPRALNPCGHSFCTSCVKTLQQCPQCRQPVESHLPSRQMENLIDHLVGIPGLLDNDDVEHFHSRKRKTSKVPPAAKIRRVRYDPSFAPPFLQQPPRGHHALGATLQVPPAASVPIMSFHPPIAHLPHFDASSILEARSTISTQQGATSTQTGGNSNDDAICID